VRYVCGSAKLADGRASRQKGTTLADLLIVDDDVDCALTLADILRASGHEVRTACDGSEGLSLLQNKQPDLVVLDVDMPVIDGPRLAQLMFLHDLGLELVPILLCSGIIDLRSTAATVGTPYFLSKPYRLESLLRLLDLALIERTAPLQTTTQPAMHP
jgi:DNA-binding response OmpR family regulator